MWWLPVSLALIGVAWIAGNVYGYRSGFEEGRKGFHGKP